MHIKKIIHLILFITTFCICISAFQDGFIEAACLGQYEKYDAIATSCDVNISHYFYTAIKCNNRNSTIRYLRLGCETKCSYCRALLGYIYLTDDTMMHHVENGKKLLLDSLESYNPLAYTILSILVMDGDYDIKQDDILAHTFFDIAHRYGINHFRKTINGLHYNQTDIGNILNKAEILSSSDRISFLNTTNLNDIKKILGFDYIDANEYLDAFTISELASMLNKSYLKSTTECIQLTLARKYDFRYPQYIIYNIPSLAFKYYNLAAAHGNIEAMRNLVGLYRRGVGIQRNYFVAFKYLILSCILMKYSYLKDVFMILLISLSLYLLMQKWLKCFKILNINNDHCNCLFVLITSYLLIQFIYVRSIIPPQIGWWNYYGWRLYNGDLLYKDLFCVLTPLYIQINSILFRIFSYNMYYYQIFGVVLRIFEIILIYKILISFTNHINALFATFIATLLTMSYLTDIPFDYNQFYRLLTETVALYTLKISIYTNNKYNIYLYLFVGFLSGITFILKETFVIIYISLIIGYNTLYIINKNYKIAIIYTSLMLLGFTFALMPFIIYMEQNNLLCYFIQCMNIAPTAKGSIPFIIKRVFNNQIRWQEIIISFIFIYYILHISERKNTLHYNITCIFSNIRSIINNIYIKHICVVIYCIALFLSIFQTKSIFDYISLYTTIILFIYMIYLHSNKNRHLLYNEPALIFAILLLTILTTYYALYDFRLQLYSTGIINAIRRSFTNITFDSLSILFIVQLSDFIQKKQIHLGLKCFIYNSIIVCYLLIGSFSSVVEELYMLPAASLLLCILSNKLKKSGVFTCGIVLSIIMIFIIVTQKEASPYSWHGWTSTRLGDKYIEYVYSNVNGLRGHVLDKETNTAYSDIADIINSYTTSTDSVYQFPSIPLFNVLCERKIGTYSVVHFFDVCPDVIAKSDLNKLKASPPALFIYCNFGSDFDMLETWFRGNKTSGQREILNFYNNYIRKNYYKVYSYRTITIWARPDIYAKNPHSLHTHTKQFAALDFTDPTVPNEVSYTSGLSYYEHDGCWSDANLSNTVSITFNKQLPYFFNLHIEGSVLSVNLNKLLLIRIGNNIYRSRIYGPVVNNKYGDFMADIKISLPKYKYNNSIIITPPSGLVKYQQWLDDNEKRNLGIHFRKLIITQSY